MTVPELFPPTFISLKDDPTLNEQWLHGCLRDDPSLLGLGDLQVIDSERRQPTGGRLDLLLRDPDSNARYEVEIQLGPTDESHLVRTIEYWDIERRRYPQYDHTAVLVAEEVTGRFLNVISLFNGHIPLIAIQLKGVEVGTAFTLVATRVLDVLPLGTEEEEEGQEVFDRAWWIKKSSSASVDLADEVLSMVQAVVPGVGPKFNKHYIGLVTPDNLVRNRVQFVPRKQHVIVKFRVDRDDELTVQLEESGLSLLAYDRRWQYYRIQVKAVDLRNPDRRAIIEKMIEAAHPGNRSARAQMSTAP